MADGLKIESGNVGAANIPGAALPQVSMPEARTDIAYQSAANYAGTLSNVLDRLTSQVFKYSEAVSERAGYQFAIDNGLTEKQLKAISDGDTSSVPTGFGSDFNVFSAAVKKYRSLEIASYAEIDVRQQLLDEQQKIIKEESEGITGTRSAAERIKDKAESITKGYRDSLSQIDPEAAFKFSAMSAKLGGELVIDAAKADAKKRMYKNAALESINYNNAIIELELSFMNGPRVDRETGKLIPVESYIITTVNDLMIKATLAGGVELAAERSKTIMKDISQAKINAITRNILDEKLFAKETLMLALRSNDEMLLATHLKESLPVWKSMSLDEQSKVRQALTLAKNDKFTADEQLKQKAKDDLNKYANEQLIRYWSLTKNPVEQGIIANDLASKGAFTRDELQKYLDPNAKEGDSYVFGDLLYKVNSGQLNSANDIKNAATASGMNGQQYTQLIRSFNEFLGKDDVDAVKYINSAAGVPDITTIRTQDDEAKFNKRDKLMNRYLNLKRSFLKEGKSFSLRDLAESVVNGYNDVDKNDVRKNNAIAEINAVVEQTNNNRTDKTKPKIIIDANTNVDDLVTKKIIDSQTRDYLKKRQAILKEK